MDASKRFHQVLKSEFATLLRADGFRGSGNTFRRINGERIRIVNIQRSQAGGKCCVNLAVHFAFLPSDGGRPVTDPKKLKEYECTFRGRLHDGSKSDHWWPYGASEAEAEASVSWLIDMYKRRADLFFRRFEPFPDVFERITPAQIDAGDFSKMPFDLTTIRAALTMARIMKHLGHPDKCREFSTVGLKHLGRAVGLKAELETLRDSG